MFILIQIVNLYMYDTYFGLYFDLPRAYQYKNHTKEYLEDIR